MQLLVAGAGRAQGELLDAVAREARVRMTVHQARHGAKAAAVELLDLAVERLQLTHAPDSLDLRVTAEHVRVLDEVDIAERGPAERRPHPTRSRELGEVPDEQAANAARRAHPCAEGGSGATSPCVSAAAAASG
jgi:hypothetical protein